MSTIERLSSSCKLCCASHKHRILQKLYTELEPLMLLDPLLLTTLVYIYPKHELHSLFANIPSLFATAWLIKDVRDDRYFLRSDVSIVIDQCSVQLLMFYFIKVEQIVNLTNIIVLRQRTESLLR